jgi:hypothetical protein
MQMRGNIDIVAESKRDLESRGLSNVNVQSDGYTLLATGTAPNGKDVRVSGRDIFSLGKSAEEAVRDSRELIKS